MCHHASSSCTGYHFVTESPTSFALSCTTSTSESLSVIWPTLCNLPPPERRAPAGAVSLSETDSYTTPRLRTKFGERAFSFSGPASASWNSLPAELRTISDKSKLTPVFSSQHLTSSRLSVCVLCISDFSVSVLLAHSS